MSKDLIIVVARGCLLLLPYAAAQDVSSPHVDISSTESVQFPDFIK